VVADTARRPKRLILARLARQRQQASADGGPLRRQTGLRPCGSWRTAGLDLPL